MVLARTLVVMARYRSTIWSTGAELRATLARRKSRWPWMDLDGNAELHCVPSQCIICHDARRTSVEERESFIIFSLEYALLWALRSCSRQRRKSCFLMPDGVIS